LVLIIKSDIVAVSEMCQKRIHASQQTARLYSMTLSARGQQRRRYFEVERFAVLRLTINSYFVG
jgi:hypothetical protein